MCGIAGALGNFAPALIEQMVHKIAHRGPDNLSWFSQGKLHLGHTRLSIVDLSEASNQPMWDVTGRLCIVFNGEIYNYQLLRQQLLEKGYQFKSNGDAEVLLNLYLEYGAELLSMVNGIFSFAIWDQQTERLWLVRDHFGVKPLYYTFTPDGLIFSSEMKSLLVCPDVSRDLDHDALLRTLVFLWSPGPHTVIRAVKKLEPGCYLTVDANGTSEITQYWDWPAYQPGPGSVESHSQAVIDSLRQSVSDQLVADVPVGSFLSGGLDSSLIVAMAAEKSRQPVDCYTIDTGDTDGFEADLPYARKVAQHLGVPLHVLKVTPDIVSLLPKMVYHLDEVQADPAPINVLLICEMARKQGIKVLLSGAGGDDVFTGYRRHYAQSVENYWSWLPLPVRKLLK
ncbi:MAG: asparagine synthase (glutamine-hydrolyzing), partial [Rheinheimera sp.]